MISIGSGPSVTMPSTKTGWVATTIDPVGVWIT